MIWARSVGYQLATSGTAYADGDQIDGVITVTLGPPMTNWVLRSVTIMERVNTVQAAGLAVILFSSDPDPASVDNQPMSIGTTACNAILGEARIASTDYVTIPGGVGGFNAKAVATVNGLFIPMSPDASSNVYAMVKVNGSTPTYGAASDRFKVILGFECPVRYAVEGHYYQ